MFRSTLKLWNVIQACFHYLNLVLLDSVYGNFNSNELYRLFNYGNDTEICSFWDIGIRKTIFFSFYNRDLLSLFAIVHTNIKIDEIPIESKVWNSYLFSRWVYRWSVSFNAHNLFLKVIPCSSIQGSARTRKRNGVSGWLDHVKRCTKINRELGL